MTIHPDQATAAEPHSALPNTFPHRAAAISGGLVRIGGFVAAGAIAGSVAAGAAFLSTLVGVPVWAMFMGWVAYFTRGHSAREGLLNYLCLALGLLVRLAAAVALRSLGPLLSTFTLPIVVFCVGLLVVSLRALPRLNNLPSYFLGVITVFAAHTVPTLKTLAELGSAAAIGSLAAWLASFIQAKTAGHR